jgi:hypothetical protein
VLGSVIYYLVEVFPGSREERKVSKTVAGISRALTADRDLHTKFEAAQANDTVENKVTLARELMSRGLAQDAAVLYESCLAGVYERDPHLLYGYADALVEAGHYERAVAPIQKLRAEHAAFKKSEVGLLSARVFEGAGDATAALAAYDAVVQSFVGLEARCRRAQLLERMSRLPDAKAAYEEVEGLARRNPPALPAEQDWAKFARERKAALDQAH